MLYALILFFWIPYHDQTCRPVSSLHFHNVTQSVCRWFMWIKCNVNMFSGLDGTFIDNRFICSQKERAHHLYTDNNKCHILQGLNEKKCNGWINEGKKESCLNVCVKSILVIHNLYRINWQIFSNENDNNFTKTNNVTFKHYWMEWNTS
jgi:hypothetical protein